MKLFFEIIAVMSFHERKVRRQIEVAAQQIDIESACRILALVLKQKARLIYGDSDNVIIKFEGETYTISYKLYKMFLEQPRSKL